MLNRAHRLLYKFCDAKIYSTIIRICELKVPTEKMIILSQDKSCFKATQG